MRVGPETGREESQAGPAVAESPRVCFTGFARLPKAGVPPAAGGHPAGRPNGAGTNSSRQG